MSVSTTATGAVTSLLFDVSWKSVLVKASA